MIERSKAMKVAVHTNIVIKHTRKWDYSIGGLKSDRCRVFLDVQFIVVYSRHN